MQHFFLIFVFGKYRYETPKVLNEQRKKFQKLSHNIFPRSWTWPFTTKPPTLLRIELCAQTGAIYLSIPGIYLSVLPAIYLSNCLPYHLYYLSLTQFKRVHIAGIYLVKSDVHCTQYIMYTVLCVDGTVQCSVWCTPYICTIY